MTVPLRLALLALLAAAPVALAQDPVLVPVAEADLPAFADDDFDRAALRRAIAEERRLARGRPDKALSLGGVETSRSALLATLERLDALLDLEPAALAAAVTSEFACYRSVGRDGAGTVMFTGYHSPQYEGSRTKTERFDTAVRKVPPDLKKPYLTRRQIDGEGQLDGQGLELLYLARLDSYLLEVQGSGSARLPDGTVVNLQYANSNGHPYTSLGKELVKDGKLTLEQASIQSIRAYFAEHPEEQDEYLFRNASYVFFTETEAPPTGCAGAAVTPGRSIATDKRLFPAGALAFVVVETPVCEGSEIVGWRRTARFVVDQDTGGAIVGAGRVDLYMGATAEAEAAAGVMKRDGALYYLLLR
jgi:membrane-bound lytic murein transglycosylase A